MNADGSDAEQLTDTPVIEESPDCQPVPITVGAPDERRTACGDLSLLPGGVASVVGVKSTCEIALGIARDWHAGVILGSPPMRIRSHECEVEPHSFDQALVQCDHRGAKKGIAFVYREPPAAPTLDAEAGTEAAGASGAARTS